MIVILITADRQERLEAAHLDALDEVGPEVGQGGRQGRFDINAMVMARFGGQLLNFDFTLITCPFHFQGGEEEGYLHHPHQAEHELHHHLQGLHLTRMEDQ